MKIKTKKQLNLPQLIEWLLNSKYSSYTAFSNMGNYVQLEEYGALIFSDEKFYPEETFTVEVEEEITEDTKLDYMYLIANNTDYSEGYYNYSINDVLSDNEGYYIELAILIIDPEPTIIWTRDKGLVE